MLPERLVRESSLPSLFEPCQAMTDSSRMAESWCRGEHSNLSIDTVASLVEIIQHERSLEPRRGPLQRAAATRVNPLAGHQPEPEPENLTGHE